MMINVNKALFERMGEAFWAKYDLTDRHFRSDRSTCSFAATSFDIDIIDDLFQRLEKEASDIRGVKLMCRDFARWRRAYVTADDGAKPRTVEQFEEFLQGKIARMVRPWLYEHDDDRNVWFANYVTGVSYHPAVRHRDHIEPEYVSVSLAFTEFDEDCTRTVYFHESDCTNQALSVSLSYKNLFFDTEELHAEYLQSTAWFDEIFNKTGKQFLARGIATDDMDGNPTRKDSWWRRTANTIHLDKQGEPARVVIDVFTEEDTKDEKKRQIHIDRWYWITQRKQLKQFLGNKVKDDEEEDVTEGEDPGRPDIPLHPMVATFDMKRHLRLRIHASQLTEYIYDTKLGEKLVLPRDVRNLVDMLLQHKGGFKDIIAAKGGGATILCAGKPGTGKTLTAEVYSEVMQRPLYSVQCSQLGVTPEDLEDELLKVFMRSLRWNAILLLDEADVYVHRRGDNLTQNAIVGVFLRTLEYYNGVLFLTTNRADSVDDAIASRCIARIDYTTPEPSDLARIWGILSATSGIDIPAAEIARIVETHPHLSGRDVKNLLKLSGLVASSSGQPVTAETINFVKRFKPTEDEK